MDPRFAEPKPGDVTHALRDVDFRRGKNGEGRIVGVIGVIGPTRLNYARVIPMVDYTARVVSRLLAG